MTRFNHVVMNGYPEIPYFLCYSQMFSASNNMITRCFPILHSKAAMILKLVNNRGTNGCQKNRGYIPRGSKYDFKPKLWVTPSNKSS